MKNLPRPVERKASGAEDAKTHEVGKTTFTRIGCASCHAAKLGTVQGIYSDLLLHDMGQQMGDDGSYTGGDGSEEDEELPVSAVAENNGEGKTPSAVPQPAKAHRGASRREWRTPPLWGFRDSGPYLHDGRAETLEQAVAMHGGQSAAAAMKFFELAPRERLAVEAFLKSLVAPPTNQVASR